MKSSYINCPHILPLIYFIIESSQGAAEGSLCLDFMTKRIYKQNFRAFLRKRNRPLFSQEPRNYLHTKQIAPKLTENGPRGVSFIDPGNSPKTPLEFENCC